MSWIGHINDSSVSAHAGLASSISQELIAYHNHPHTNHSHTYINSTHFNHTTSRFLQSITNQRSSLSFSLCLNHSRLSLSPSPHSHNLLLLSTSHNELGLLSTLQSHLLLLNGVVEVRSEGQMSN